MRTKIIVMLSLVLMLALSACGVVPSASGNQAAARTLFVNGVGQVQLSPDIAYIHIGVRTEASSASTAVAQNNVQTNRVIDALKDFGVEEKDIRTSNFSIWPTDKYDPMTGMPTGEKAIVVENTVYVTVRDLDTLGELLDKVIDAGANTIHNIQFDVSDKVEALTQAREAAVKNAREQATQLAALADVKLGEIQNISFYDAVPYPAYDDYAKGGAAVLEAAVPIQPGQMTLQVTVSITYEIK